MYYDFTELTLAGNCTIPDSTASNASVSVRPCMTGTFDPSSHLFFNVTSAVPFNNTLSASYPSGVSNFTTSLTIPSKTWYYSHYAPAVTLEQLDTSADAEHVVLKTTVTDGSDTRLKVCVSGVVGREVAMVGPEVFAPLGLILMKQADYALWATQPPSTTN